MKPVLMMVTWFYFGEPPQSSNAEFGSMEACQAARHEVFRSATRLKYEAETEAQTGWQRGITNMPHLPAPTVSAICVAQ